MLEPGRIISVERAEHLSALQNLQQGDLLPWQSHTEAEIKIKYPAFELERDLSSNNAERNPAGFDQLNTFDLVNKTLLTKSFNSTKMK